MTANARGIASARNVALDLTPAIQLLAGAELGYDDKGLFDGSESFDAGYQTVQSYLSGQGKENDLALKGEMLSDFIAKADAIPDSIKGDSEKYDAALVSAANYAIKRQASKGMANIDLGHIAALRLKPETADKFDEVYGAGAANKVLGR